MPPDSTAELPPITRPSLRISIPPASRPSRPPRASRASPISSISPISPRDYSHSDYTPRDPLEAVYDWNTRTFSYKRHSKIEQSAIQARIAKGAKKLEVKPRNIRDECGINIGARTLTLPMRVYWGRKWLGKFKVLFIEGEINN